jgi:Ser/Thr protein kinase RdoA (MazF antagonist)
MVKSILPEFLPASEDMLSEPFGSGLINTTWRVYNHQREYILQKINTTVFQHPHFIAENVRKIADYLQQKFPSYQMVVPVKTRTNEELAYIKNDGYYRLVPFVKGSHTLNVVNTADEAYEAAKQFGKFTALLSGMDARELHNTIPDFHNLRLRYEQFQQSLQLGNTVRIAAATEAINYIQQQVAIVEEYDAICKNPEFKIRVMHHDTKINNVLLNNEKKGICVIDLDTVMPGYFISDAGDMLRTYLSPASEEENDLQKNAIREDIFAAIVKGYMEEMKAVLTPAEKAAFVYAGKFMIYMQAIRFLADHFNNDIYYGARYEGHNYYRAMNQIDLLQKLIAKEKNLLLILNNHI